MTNPTPLPRANPLDNLEQAIHSGAQAIREGARLPAVTQLMPTKMRELDELGQMSADAVLVQYQATAAEVEKMGAMVQDMVKKLGQSLQECDNDMKVVAETAAAIRDKGKHSQALIEQVSALSTEIREACAEFKKKVGL